jgi:hypothetical protein
LGFFLLCLSTLRAHAGPPFFTDDPEPVEFHHYEFYIFSTVDRAPDGYGVVGPAFELNYGAAPNLQLHIVAPLQLAVPNEGPITFGVGDVELGVKYRFIQEKGWHPQVGMFPMVLVPSGDASRGLGNGRAVWKLPIWVQKSWGHGWQSYGGGGYIVNPPPGMRDHPFFGWQMQKEVDEKLTLGGEWFNPGRDTFAGNDTHILNFGGIYGFNKNFCLLFTGGHSVQGESHTVAYLGLYWTWGPEGAEEKTNAKSTAMSSLFRRAVGRSGGR